jgi:uncharacterized damage-inducible protein DinB
MTTATATTSFTMGALMRQYTEYNLWANTTIVNWLRMKPVSDIEEYVPSSFPGIKETLIHIWDTERFWLSVISNTEIKRSFREGFEGTTDGVLDGVGEHSESFMNFVTGLDDDELTEEVSLDTPWVSGTRPRFEFIQHCMNHSTYHRGQIITIGRILGYADAPMTDYNFYLFLGK